jgi:hydroxypyruvate isomerase
MPRFSANLSIMFAEYDFMDRFERAAKAGFKAVEYMFPYPYEKVDLVDKLEQHGLTQVLMNLPAGNWDAGERGIAVIPGREGEFRRGVDLAIDYAKALKVSRINCLVGLTPTDVAPEQARASVVANLGYAAQVLATKGLKLLIEALNTNDIPGFYLSSTADAVALIAEVNHPNLFIQYDVYHMQVMEGNLTDTIRKNIGRIGHIQIADVPGRHEPGTGEINYTNLFRFIDEAGYDGFIGCEYRPATKTEEGLGWMKPYL